MSEQIAFPLPVSPEVQSYFQEWCAKEGISSEGWPDWFVFMVWENRPGWVARAVAKGIKEAGEDNVRIFSI